MGENSLNQIGKSGMDILVTKNENRIMTIKLNRPEKKNAISTKMFFELTKLFENANSDDRVKLVVLTGSGQSFSSGNDLNNFSVDDGDMESVAEKARQMLQSHFAALIDLRKPIVALVNGPAVGLGVTWLGLCDMVIASDKATFHTPFSSLGLTPECCSSFTFPRMMGYPKASSLLLFGEKIVAKEAAEYGLVSKVIPDSEFWEETGRILKKIAGLPMDTLLHTKSLIRDPDREMLHKVNKAECERLKERCAAPDCLNAILNVFALKAKL